MKPISNFLCFILAAATLAIAPATFASPCQYFYVSAAAGIAQTEFASQYLDQTDVIPQNIVQSSFQHAYPFALAAGYRWHFTPTYFIGAEATYDLREHYARYQAGAASIAFSDKALLDYQVNLSIAPGIRLSPKTSASLKIGVSLAHIEDHLASPAGYVPVLQQTSLSGTQAGLRLGLNIEHTLLPQLALFTEAAYTDYGSENFMNFDNFTATYTHSAHIYDYEVLLGLIYKFV